MTCSMRAAPVCLASLVLLGAPLAAAQRAPLARAAISQEATSLSPAATPPSQVAPSSTDAALPIPPLPNRVDSVLPSWLRVGGEFRERFEGFDNGNFIDGRDDYYALSRVRVNAMVTASRSLSFQASVQDARVAGKTIGPTTPPFRGPFDLRTAYADIGDANARIAFRLGRQELTFGEQRLLGNLSWTNTGRSWDAGRVILRSKMFQADVFGASLVRSLPDEFDKSGGGNRLAGVYASSTTLVPEASVEPFFFFHRDTNLGSELGAIGELHQVTIGTRVAGKLPAGLDYSVELALQRGELAEDSIHAWAGHWQIRESLPGAGAIKLISEYNLASGDDNATDGRRGTFDQLYPTGHDKLGLSDQVGWRNVHHLREGVELTPIRATPIAVSYHTWWLANGNDALYGASGAVIAPPIAGGTANTHVGQELDLQVTRALTPQIQLAAGYAHVFTGAFLKQATPGASYSQPYVMITYVFLGEK